MDLSISRGPFPDEEDDFGLQHNRNNGNDIVVEAAIKGMLERTRVGSSNVGATNYPESESVDQEECDTNVYGDNRDAGINVSPLSKPVGVAHNVHFETDHQYGYAAATAEEICLDNEISVNDYILDADDISTEEVLDDLENREQFEQLPINSLIDSRKLNYGTNCFNNISRDDSVEELPAPNKCASIQKFKEDNKTFIKLVTNSPQNVNRVETTSSIVYKSIVPHSKNLRRSDSLKYYYESIGPNLADDDNNDSQDLVQEMPKLENETEVRTTPHDVPRSPPHLIPEVPIKFITVNVNEQAVGVVRPFNHENNLNIDNQVSNISGVSILSNNQKPLNPHTKVITQNRLRSHCLDSVRNAPKSMIKKQESFPTVISTHGLKTKANPTKLNGLVDNSNYIKREVIGISSGNHYRIPQKSIKHVSKNINSLPLTVQIHSVNKVPDESFTNIFDCDEEAYDPGSDKSYNTQNEIILNGQPMVSDNKSNIHCNTVCNVKSDKIIVSERRKGLKNNGSTNMPTLPSMPSLQSPTGEEPININNTGETSKTPDRKDMGRKQTSTRVTATRLRSCQRLPIKEFSSPSNNNKKPVHKRKLIYDKPFSGSRINNTVTPIKQVVHNVNVKELEEQATEIDLLSDSSFKTLDNPLTDLDLDKPQTNSYDESVPSLDPFIKEIPPTIDILGVLPCADILDGGIIDKEITISSADSILKSDMLEEGPLSTIINLFEKDLNSSKPVEIQRNESIENSGKFSNENELSFTIPDTKFEDDKISLESPKDVNSIYYTKPSFVEKNKLIDNIEVGSKTNINEVGGLVLVSDTVNHDKIKSKVLDSCVTTSNKQKVSPFTIAPERKEYDTRNNIFSEFHQIRDMELANTIGDLIISDNCSKNPSLPSLSSCIREENRDLNEIKIADIVIENNLPEDTSHVNPTLSKDSVNLSSEDGDLLKLEKNSDQSKQNEIDENLSIEQKNIPETDSNNADASLLLLLLSAQQTHETALGRLNSCQPSHSISCKDTDGNTTDLIPNGRVSPSKMDINDLPCRRDRNLTINHQDICKQVQEDNANFSNIENREIEKSGLMNSFSPSKSKSVKNNKNEDIRIVVGPTTPNEIGSSSKVNKGVNVTRKQIIKSSQHNNKRNELKEKKAGLEDVIKKLKSEKNTSHQYVDKWHIEENKNELCMLKTVESPVIETENSDGSNKIETEIIHDNLDAQLEMEIDLIKTNENCNESHVLNEIKSEKFNKCVAVIGSKKVNTDSILITKSSQLLNDSFDNNIVSEIKVNLSCQKKCIEHRKKDRILSPNLPIVINQPVLTNELITENEKKSFLKEVTKQKNHEVLSTATTKTCIKIERNDNTKQKAEGKNILLSPFDALINKEVQKSIRSINDEKMENTDRPQNVEIGSGNENSINVPKTIEETINAIKITETKSSRESINDQTSFIDVSETSRITQKVFSVNNQSNKKTENVDLIAHDDENVNVAKQTFNKNANQQECIESVNPAASCEKSSINTNLNAFTEKPQSLERDGPTITDIDSIKIADEQICKEHVNLTVSDEENSINITEKTLNENNENPLDIESKQQTVTDKENDTKVTEKTFTENIDKPTVESVSLTVTDINADGPLVIGNVNHMVSDEDNINTTEKTFTENPLNVNNTQQIITDKEKDVNITEKFFTENFDIPPCLESASLTVTDDINAYKPVSIENVKRTVSDDENSINITEKKTFTENPLDVENIQQTITGDESNVNTTEKTFTENSLDTESVQQTVSDVKNGINVIEKTFTENTDKPQSQECVNQTISDNSANENANESLCLENVNRIVIDDGANINTTEKIFTEKPCDIESSQQIVIEVKNDINLIEKTFTENSDRPQSPESVSRAVSDMSSNECLENVNLTTIDENSINTTEKTFTENPPDVENFQRNDDDNSVNVNDDENSDRPLSPESVSRTVSDMSSNECLENVNQTTSDENSINTTEKTFIENPRDVENTKQTDKANDRSVTEKTFTENTDKPPSLETVGLTVRDDISTTENDDENIINTTEKTFTEKPLDVENIQQKENNLNVTDKTFTENTAIPCLESISLTVTDDVNADKSLGIENVNQTVRDDENSINITEKKFTENPLDAENIQQAITDEENHVNVTEKTFTENTAKPPCLESVSLTVTDSINVVEPYSKENVNQTVSDTANNIDTTEKIFSENTQKPLDQESVLQTVTDEETYMKISEKTSTENTDTPNSFDSASLTVSDIITSKNSDEPVCLQKVSRPISDENSINNAKKIFSESSQKPLDTKCVQQTITGDDSIVNTTDKTFTENSLDTESVQQTVSDVKNDINVLDKPSFTGNAQSLESIGQSVSDMSVNENADEPLCLENVNRTINDENSVNISEKTFNENPIDVGTIQQTVTDEKCIVSIPEKTFTENPLDTESVQQTVSDVKNYINVINKTSFTSNTDKPQSLEIVDQSVSVMSANENADEPLCLENVNRTIDENSVNIPEKSFNENPVENIEQTVTDEEKDKNVTKKTSTKNTDKPSSVEGASQTARDYISAPENADEPLSLESVSLPFTDNVDVVEPQSKENVDRTVSNTANNTNTTEKIFSENTHKPLDQESVLHTHTGVKNDLNIMECDDVKSTDEEKVISAQNIDGSVKSIGFTEFTKNNIRKDMDSSEQSGPQVNNKHEDFIQEFTKYIDRNNRFQIVKVVKREESPSEFVINDNLAPNNNQPSVTASGDSTVSIDQGNNTEETSPINLRPEVNSQKQKQYPSSLYSAIDNPKLSVSKTNSILIPDNIDVTFQENSEINTGSSKNVVDDCHESEMSHRNSDFAVGKNEPKTCCNLSAQAPQNIGPSENEAVISNDTDIVDNQVSLQSEAVDNFIVQPLSGSTEIENFHLDNSASKKDLLSKTEESASDYSATDSLEQIMNNEEERREVKKIDNPSEQENASTRNREDSLAILQHRSLTSGSDNLGLNPNNYIEPDSSDIGSSFQHLGTVHIESDLNSLNSERLSSFNPADSNLSNSSEEKVHNLPEEIHETEVTNSQANITSPDCTDPNSGTVEYLKNSKKSKSKPIDINTLGQTDDSADKQEESTSNVIVANYFQSSILVKPTKSKSALLIMKSDIDKITINNERNDLAINTIHFENVPKVYSENKMKENVVSSSVDQNNETESNKIKLDKQDEINKVNIIICGTPFNEANSNNLEKMGHHDSMSHDADPTDEIVKTNCVNSVLSKATQDLTKNCIIKKVKIVLEKIDISNSSLNIQCATNIENDDIRKRQMLGHSKSVKRTSNTLFNKEEPPNKISKVPKLVDNARFVKKDQERSSLRNKRMILRKRKTEFNTGGNLSPTFVLLSRLDTLSKIYDCLHENKVKRLFIPRNVYYCLKKDTCQPSDVQITFTKSTERNRRFKRRRRKSSLSKTDDESDTEDESPKNRLERPRRSNKRMKQEKGLNNIQIRSNSNDPSFLSEKNEKSTKVISQSESLSIHGRTISSSMSRTHPSIKRHHESEIDSGAVPKRSNLNNKSFSSYNKSEGANYSTINKPIDADVAGCSSGHRTVLKVGGTMKEILLNVVRQRLTQAAEPPEDEEDSDDDFMGFEPCSCSLGGNTISQSCRGNCYIRKIEFKIGYLNRMVKLCSKHSTSLRNKRICTFRPSMQDLSEEEDHFRSNKSRKYCEETNAKPFQDPEKYYMISLENLKQSSIQLLSSNNVEVPNIRRTRQLTRTLETKPSSETKTDKNHEEDSDSSS
ncbi:unnamed protein product [Nezara viridula]|uniref:Uncharacterized protein n=1 Tax=Nezara viridula TaxID=85310 RepID=A0A9P0HMB5_NEZVI|nr:unnamed protein product [Nezara viridula]